MALTVFDEYKNILYLNCRFKQRRMNDIIAIPFFKGRGVNDKPFLWRH